MIIHYLKVAFRNLWKYKVQSIIGIFCMAIGLVCFALCNYYTQFYFKYNYSLPNSKRMYELRTNVSQDDFAVQFPDIEYMVSSSIITLEKEIIFDTGGEKIPYKEFICAQDTTFINFFSVEMIVGNLISVKNTSNSVVVTESMAKKLGYEKMVELIGFQIEIDESIYVIAGVVKDFPANSVIRHLNNAFIVFNRIGQKSSSGWWYNDGFTNRNYVLLRENVSKKKFEEKLDNYFSTQPNSSESNGEESYKLTSVRHIFDWSHYNIKMSLFFLIFGLLILLITIFNFVSFRISMTYSQQKNYAIKKMNGITKMQLFGAVFSEFMVHFIIACCVAFVFVGFISAQKNFYNQILHTELVPLALRTELLQYVFYGLLLLFFISLIFTAIIEKTRVYVLISGGNEKGNNLGRYMLLFGQLVVLLLFMCSTLIVNRQTNYTKKSLFSNIPLNEQTNIFHINCAYYDGLKGKNDILIQNLRESKNISAVTYSVEPVLRSRYSMGYEKIEGIENQIVRKYEVASNFFDFFHANLIQGNLIDENTEWGNVVVNPAFARLFPDEPVIGKTFTYGNGYDYHVIGVIDNLQIVEYSIDDKVNLMEEMPLFFSKKRLVRQDYFTIYAQAAEGKRKEAHEDIVHCMREFIPENYELDIEIFKDEFDKTFSTEIMISSLSTTFFIFSLLLGLVSIYSSVLFNVEKRRKEVAIRKINGAMVKDIIGLFGKTYVWLWTAACIVAFPFVWYFGNRWLENYADRTTIGMGLFIGVYIFILILIILTVIFQIVKTARLNPADVLKTE